MNSGDQSDFNDLLEKRIASVKSIIERYLPDEKGFQCTLKKAVNYSMLSGGKKLRPLLMEQTYKMFGGTSEVVEPFMAAIEMIHTHSLIHDDLPALDNDTYRRGRKTTHAVYGEAMAVIAGDALLNLAYETAAKAFAIEPGSPYVARAFSILAKKAGIEGMMGGQSVDVEYSGRPLSEERMDFIYSLKTGALIEAAMMIGAVLAGAPDTEIEKTEQAAHCIGMAFQIQDDILDVTGNAQELGKSVNNDEKNNKTTFVSIKGIEAAGAAVEYYSREALRILDELPFENVFLNELIADMIHRRS